MMAKNSWIENLKITHQKHDIVLIEKAYLFAENHDTKTSPQYGTSSFAFGLLMAETLIALNCDTHAIAAALLYPTLFLNPNLTEQLEKEFDRSVLKLMLGALHMEAIHHVRNKKIKLAAQQNQIDNLRKMLLAMVDDIRTVLIKLAERLVLLNHLKFFSPEMQQQIAQDTMDYYAPLANRLGIGQLKWQLEDEAFRYLNSAEYISISKTLNMKRQDRDRVIVKMITELKKMFDNSGIEKFDITGRAKHIYSIYRKIQKKSVGFKDIYDASALRVLVSTIHDCYTALSLVHAKWPHVKQEFDDYIAKPKSNGYQSIHTAITLPNSTAIEIQIRTFQMHDSAELGVAAHWKYKENQTTQTKYENKIAWLREVMDWQKELSAAESSAKLYQEAFKDRVYVFSPEGDAFDLASGATPLDFAYLIHTDIGHRCRGAKVNNVLVPLTTILHTGDRIDIMTSKILQPSRDWMRPDLGYLKTKTALQKVRHYFKKQEFEKEVAAGALIWEKSYKQHGFQKTDLQKILHDFNFKNTDSILAALGAGDISLSAIAAKIQATKPKEKTDELLVIKAATQAHSHSFDFASPGAKQLLTQIAKCCNPIPGDAVIGYITQGRGITVHQKICSNIKRVQKSKSERLIEINWGDSDHKNYRINIDIVSEDRTGLLHDVSSVLTQLDLSILALQSLVNKNNNSAFITLSIELDNQHTLATLLQKLKQIRGVSEVTRK